LTVQRGVKENVLAEIVSLLGEFADGEYQKRVWLEGRGPEVSSFVDATIAFISGCEIDHVITVEWTEWGLPTEAVEPLKRFRQRLGGYLAIVGSDPPIAEVLPDPRWNEIRQLAQRALDGFREYGVTEGPS